MTEDDWKRLRKTIQSGVANGMILAFLVVALLGFLVRLALG